MTWEKKRVLVTTRSDGPMHTLALLAHVRAHGRGQAHASSPAPKGSARECVARPKFYSC